MLCLAVYAQAAEVDWPVNGGPDNIRYTTLAQITPANVASLQLAWTYDAHDAFKDSEMQSNPIVVDGLLYATTPKMRVIALDAATGREVWSFDPSAGAPAAAPLSAIAASRCIKTAYFSRIAIFCTRSTESTGKPIQTFGDNGRIDLRNGLDRPPECVSISASSPGVIFEDMIIMPSTVPETLPGSPGHIRAFDVNTGKQRWIFHTIPHPGEFGYETWPPDAYKISGGANAWAGLSIDPKLGMVFAATGSASFDFYGSNRIGDDLFADCVLALDARTGKRIWHFQGIRHDVWDLDFPAAPSLVTVTRNGKKVEAVAQITKTGYVLRLRSTHGRAAVSHRESQSAALAARWRKARRNAAVSAETSAVHAPDVHGRHGHQSDAGGARGRARQSCGQLDSNGIFTPPSTRGTMLIPGTDGGGEWGGAAFDPETALLYVNSNEQPWIIRMVTHDTTSLYNNNCASCHRTDRNGRAADVSLARSTSASAARARKSRSIIREGTGRMPGVRLSGPRDQ